MHSLLPQREIVLVGAGHTHAHVLRMWRMRPRPDTRLTCVNDHWQATYSGMLPGTLAGLYSPERMQIDLVRLCAAAGVRLVRAEVTGLDRAGQRLLFAERPPLAFDLLSVGIGSVPAGRDRLPDDAALVPIKPMQTFLARLERRLEELAVADGGGGRGSPEAPRRAVIVGGGVAGVEIAFCLPARLAAALPGRRWRLTIVDRGAELGPGLSPRARALVLRELARRGVEVLLDCDVWPLGGGRLQLAGGQTLEADLLLWATGAEAPPLLARLGLSTDPRGFLLTRATLQTVDSDQVFAVGDSGTLATGATPKAGVYAVRQGPVLWENLQAALDGRPLAEYRPQRDFLRLLATGDGRAILDYKGLAAHGRWCWRLKDRIDGRFIDMFHDYAPAMPAAPPPVVSSGPAMRCAGCGGKIGGSVLSAALARLEVPRHEDVVLGLEAPDDVALVRAPPAGLLAVTADFFVPPLDDPFLAGRIAMLNALGDLFASGARPVAALALATLPVGPARPQEELLYQLLSGALAELRPLGATLVGGHTIEGSQTTIGFTLLGRAAERPRTKAGLRPGDALVLTKPLGAGVLLAAHARTECRAEWFAPLLASLLESNAAEADCAARFGLRGATDVTGFGLAGHLREMLLASNVSATLELPALPLLPGAAELLATGRESTLAPANRGAVADVLDPPAADIQGSPAYQALFDPQTNGGLLLGVPQAEVELVLEALRGSGAVHTAVIGQVAAAGAGNRRLRVSAEASVSQSRAACPP